MEEKETRYQKILIARYSPENKCYAEDGAILYLKPKELKRKRDHVRHYFLDHLDKKTKSQYGWVKKVDPLTLNEFIEKYVGENPNIQMRDHNLIMLESIQNLNEDIPVGVTYSERGVEEKRLELTVHRVFFL